MGCTLFVSVDIMRKKQSATLFKYTEGNSKFTLSSRDLLILRVAICSYASEKARGVYL